QGHDDQQYRHTQSSENVKQRSLLKIDQQENRNRQGEDPEVGKTTRPPGLIGSDSLTHSCFLNLPRQLKGWLVRQPSVVLSGLSSSVDHSLRQDSHSALDRIQEEIPQVSGRECSDLPD